MGNWRDQCRDKLVSADEAVKRIQPGDTVAVAPFITTPHTLCNALIGACVTAAYATSASTIRRRCRRGASPTSSTPSNCTTTTPRR